MRVISELIDYLLARGSLTSEQIQWLTEKNYLKAPGHEYRDSDDWEPYVENEYDLLARDDQELEERIAAPRAGRAKRGGRPRGATLSAKQLAKILADAIPSWRENLGGLLTLARRWKPVEYEEMPLAIRNVADGVLREAVAATVDRGGPALRTLWHAATFDGWMQSLPKDASGPAVNAFRFAIGNPNRPAVGTHAWLLREPAVRWIYQLTQAQSRIQPLLCEYLTTRPADLLRSALEDWDVTMYVALLLVWNARRRRRPSDMQPIEIDGVKELRLCEPWLYVHSAGSHSLFDVRTGERVFTEPVQSGDGVPALSVGSGEPRVAWIARGHIDIHEGLKQRTRFECHLATRLRAWFVSNGGFLLVAHDSGFEFCRTRPFQVLQTQLYDTVAGFAVTPGGDLLVAWKSAQLQLWDLAARQALPANLSVREFCRSIGHWNCAIRGDELWFCATDERANSEGRIHVFYGTCCNGELRHRGTAWVTHPIRGVAMGGDPMVVAVATERGICFFPAGVTGEDFEVHFPEESIEAAVYDPDGFWMVQHSSGPATLHAADGRFLRYYALPSGTLLAYLPQPKRLALRTPSPSIAEVMTWHANQLVGTLVRRIRVDPGIAERAAFSPDGETLAIATSAGIEFHSMRQGTPEVPQIRDKEVKSIAFGSDSRTLVIERHANYQRQISVMDLDNRERSWTLNPHLSAIVGVAEPAGSGVLITADASGLICFWSLPELKVLDRLHLDASIRGLALGGERLFTWSNSGTIHCIGWRQRALIVKWKLPINPSALTCTPDGTLLFAGDAHGRIWIFEEEGQCRGSLLGHDGAVTGVACDAGGRTLYSGAADGVRIWDLDYYLPEQLAKAPVPEPLANETEWKNAWSEALRIDAVNVTPFLAHFSRQHERALRSALSRDSKNYSYAELGLFRPDVRLI